MRTLTKMFNLIFKIAMTKYSMEARELLSNSELYEIKAGKNEETTDTVGTCSVMCSTCIACTSCTSCTTKMLDVIPIIP